MNYELTEDEVQCLRKSISDVLNIKKIEHFEIEISQTSSDNLAHNEMEVTLSLNNGLFEGKSTYYSQRDNDGRIALLAKPRNERNILSSMTYTRFYLDNDCTASSLAYHLTGSAFDNLNKKPDPIKRRQPALKL